jgi:hypothetical protein
MEDTEQDIYGEELKETKKLPSLKQRIKQCLEDMWASGITYGSFFPNDFFEKRLFMSRDDRDFSINIHKIRVELEKEGFYLNGYGQNRKGFVILMANGHVGLSRRRSRSVKRTMRRDVTLMIKTRVDGLTLHEKELHEKETRNAVVQHLSVERSKGVEKMIRNRFPQIELEVAS